MFLAAFEPTVPASKQPQIHASNHTATGIGLYCAWRSNTFVLEDCILLEYDAVSIDSQICTLPLNVGSQLAIDAAL